MKTILFCRTNQGNDLQLSDILHRNLPDYYRVITVSRPLVSAAGTGEPLLFLETDELPECDLPNAVLLFGEQFHPGAKQPILGTPLCITASDNQPLLQAISDSRAQVITCGMSPKDTFSCSGKNEASAAVSLLRRITNCAGDTIEPLELVFTLPEEFSVYNLLAYTAVLTLLGNLSESPKSSLIIR